MLGFKDEEQCLICYSSDDDLIYLNCGCSYCDECLVHGVNTKIKEHSFQIGTAIPCMKSGCLNEYSIEEITSLLPPESAAIIHEGLFQAYLRNTDDVKRCPTANCPYAGIVHTSSTCKNKLECAVCRAEWSEKPDLSKMDLLKTFIKFQHRNKDELLTLFWKLLQTKKCPKCKVRIQKNQGCDHMTCRGCKHEFCWICYAVHPGHKRLWHFFSKVKVVLLSTIAILMALILLRYSLHQIIFVPEFAKAILMLLFYVIMYPVFWVWSILSGIISYLLMPLFCLLMNRIGWMLNILWEIIIPPSMSTIGWMLHIAISLFYLIMNVIDQMPDLIKTLIWITFIGMIHHWKRDILWKVITFTARLLFKTTTTGIVMMAHVIIFLLYNGIRLMLSILCSFINETVGLIFYLIIQAIKNTMRLLIYLIMGAIDILLDIVRLLFLEIVNVVAWILPILWKVLVYLMIRIFLIIFLFVVINTIMRAK